jgi:hypothetical protein
VHREEVQIRRLLEQSSKLFPQIRRGKLSPVRHTKQLVEHANL